MVRSSWPFFFVFAWMSLLLAHSWYGPDVWYHLYWGRDLVESGKWWPEPPVLLKQPIAANGYWLFQALLYLVYKWSGLIGGSTLFALLWIAIACMWLHLSQLWRKPLGYWLFFAFVVTMQLRFEQRPEVFSYFFLTLMTWLAFRERIWPLFVVQILWTGFHGYFVMGPFVAAVVLFHIKPDWRRAATVGGALLASTLVNPFGYKVWINVWYYLGLGTALRDLNHELSMPTIWPLYFPTTVFWLAWLATLAMIVGCLARRVHIVPAVLALGGLILGGQTTRNMPLLFLLAPLLWRNFNWQFRSVRWTLASGALVSLAAIAMCVKVWTGDYHRWVGSLSTFGVQLEWASYPIGAVEFLRKGNFRGKIFADSYDGGYIEYHLDGVQIAGDSYFSDPNQTRRFFGAIKDPSQLVQLNSQLGFDAMIINIENTDVMNMMLSNQEWVAGYADSHRTVFVRRESNPLFNGDLTQFTFYHGEDLKNWTYEFGIISWMALAYQRQLPGVIKKILTDLAPQKRIPDTAFNIALKYAAATKDEEIMAMLATFSKSQN